MTLRFNNEKASAQFFHLIWEYAPKNQKVYIMASILLIAFQTGFIFSKELSEIYLSNSNSYSKKSSIMDKDSIFNKISSLFDIIVMARSLSPGFLIFTLITILTTTIMINLSFRRFDIAKKLINFKKSVRNRNKIIVLFSVLMMNYDIFFFVLSMVGFNAIPCRIITVKEKVGIESNYIEQNSFENVFFNSWNNSLTEIEVKRNVSYLNNNILCYSNNHILMAILGILIFINNILLKVMANKLMNFVPSFKVFACKFGNSDLVYDLILLIILVTKTISFIHFKTNMAFIRIIFGIYFILLVFGYSVLFTLTPYYNRYQHRLKCFQVLYLLNLTGFSILVRETKFKIFNSEISTLIFMSVTMTFLIKLNDNLSMFGIDELVKRWKKRGNLMTSREILKVYYIISTYIRTAIDNEDIRYMTGVSDNDDVVFLIKFLLEKHKKKCKKIHCFCKKSKISLKISPFDLLKSKVENHMVFEALMLLEEMLHEVVIQHKSKSPYLLYCYINFLTCYMAKPTLAYKLIYEAKQKNSKKMRMRKNGKKGELEFNALLYNIEYISCKNLDTGKLSLLALEEEIRDFSTKSNQMKVLDHILFLNRIEEMKRNIRKAMKVQLNSLCHLRDEGNIQICYNDGVEFLNLRKIILSEFDILVEKCGGRYAPLYLNFGCYVLNCCQNRVMANKILNTYMKRMVIDCNLHEIFFNFEIEALEFSTLYVSTNPKKFHQIVYASSNIFKYTGFKNIDLQGKDLGLILPNPIRNWHKSFLDQEKMTGKFLQGQELRQLFCLNVNKNLVQIKLGIRLNTTVKNGIEFCGILNFTTENRITSPILLTSKNGRITSLTESAMEYFLEDTKLESYNKIFKTIYQVSEEKLILREKGEKFEIILKDKKRMKYWGTYSEWSREKEINILSKSGKVIRMGVSFQDYHLHQIGKFFRIMVVHRTRTQIFGLVSINDDPEKLEEKSLKKMMEYINKDVIEAEKILNEKEEEIEREVEGGEIEDLELSKRIRTRRLVLKNFPVEVKGNDDRMENEESKELDMGGNENFADFKQSERNKEKSSGSYDISDEDEDNLFGFKGIKFSTTRNMDESKRSRRKKKKITIAKKKKKEDKIRIINLNVIHPKEDRASSGSSMNPRAMKSNRIEKILNKYFHLNKWQKIDLSAMLILILFFIVHFSSVVLKDPIQEITNLDLKTQSVNVDIFTWEIFGHAYTVFFTDMCRAVREGWIENKSPLDPGNKTLFELCHEVRKVGSDFYLPPDNKIDINIRAIRLKWLYDYEGWINTQVKIPQYFLNKDFNKIEEWKNLTLRRRTGIKIMQNLAFMMEKRDYENDTSIPSLGEGRNREKDEDEEMLRRGSLGDLNFKYTMRSYDFYEYLKAVAEFNQDFVTYSILISCSISIITFLLFSVCVGFEVQSMRKFYLMILDMKIGNLNKTIKIYRKKFKNMQNFLLEEKIYESQIDKIRVHPEIYLKKMIQLEVSDQAKKGRNSSMKVKNTRKVSLQRKNFFFGFIKLLVIFLISIGLIIFFQLFYYWVLIPKGERLKNLVKVSILNTEIWSSFVLLHTFAFETILWNNTMPVWNTDSLTAFRMVMQHVKYNVLENITEALDYDLGNYTDIYVNQMSKGNSCETVWGLEKEVHPDCYRYYDGHLNSNFMLSIKGIISSINSQVTRWELERNNFENIKKLMKSSSFRYFLIKFRPTLTTLYYSLTTDVTNYLMKELDEKLELLQLTQYFMIMAIFFSCGVIYFQVVKRTSFLLANFLSIVFLLPVCLLERNLILKHHLKRVNKGGHLWKF